MTPAQIPQELITPKMRFSKIIRHQKAEVIIYGKKKNYPFYRIIYRADGKRRMKHFAKYSDVLKEAEEKAEQLWKAHPIVALSTVQTRDAITAFQMPDAFQPKGERISLSTIVSEAIDLLKRASGRSMRKVGNGFLASVTNVNRTDLATAVSEFLQAAENHQRGSVRRFHQKRPQPAQTAGKICSHFSWNGGVRINESTC